MNEISVYPEQASQRDEWILGRRPERNPVDPKRPYAFLVEQERTHTGQVAPVATIFLTNRECPWRCVMCDLWKNTLLASTSPGNIPEQIEYALTHLPPASQIKLYNSGSFFDRQAIPPSDYARIAELVNAHERVIVESHPILIGDLVLDLRDRLRGQLEVALGLETAHPAALEKLNKRFTVDQFAAAADRLRKSSVDLRVFVLVQPPFIHPEESLLWTERSLDLAFDCGATAVTLIPTRGGNGAMEELARAGQFTPPNLSIVETAFNYGVSLKRGRVFVDLWDIAHLPCCPHCSKERIERLSLSNLSQQLIPSVSCSQCGGAS